MGNQKRSKDKGFAFVITDTSGRTNSEDRKLIRSHVMRGKNRRATCANPVNPKRSSSWVTHDTTEPVQETNQLYHVPNDLYMFQFAEDVDAGSRAMLFEFYGVIKETMYPIEWCLSLDSSKNPWFYWLMSDAAFLHSILFTVGLLHDSIVGKTSKRTSFHVWKTLSLLNQNISDKDLALADSTIATVVSMCMVSEVFGDRDSAAAHVKGMRRIVELRGGIETFRHNLQLKIKICRVDIGWYLCTGEKPHYYRDTISWETAFASILGDSPAGFERDREPCQIRRLLNSTDRRVGNIFQDLHDFSQLANFLVQTGHKIDPNMFQDLMTSIQYRLLYLEPTTQDKVTEMLRLGMTSYITTLFLKVQGTKIPLSFLTGQLRSACQNIEVSEFPSTTARHIFAWTLVVGAISVLEEYDDVWLLPKLASLRESLGPTWPEAKAKLEQVMWMEFIHSPGGVKVFEKLVLHVAKVPPTSSLQRKGPNKPALSPPMERLSSVKDVIFEPHATEAAVY
ncbi:uncharacterized protein ColSpa_09890 [Colletotrichum spaethianum]|uniref:C6 zinc finger domain-containing protein n=1 Tax=Colletotrichum spaethianum TaxID=700344 RepID=A0AA37UJI3_9PEZI|nr:uncharacterized protein ColSpa_09890 [Colletotrichum spaethianum]GKT49709.1 hypothetical protein ColSpa_09890 [Colletotrichum spaethianum]